MGIGFFSGRGLEAHPGGVSPGGHCHLRGGSGKSWRTRQYLLYLHRIWVVVGGSENMEQTHVVHGQEWGLDPWETHPGHIGRGSGGGTRSSAKSPALEGTSVSPYASFSTGNMEDVFLGRGLGWEEVTGLPPQAPQAAES